MKARNKEGTHSIGGITEKVTAHKTLRTRRQKYNYIQKQRREVSQLIKMPE